MSLIAFFGNFLIVITAQLLFLLLHARALGQTRELPRYVLLGIAIGIPFGALFDVIFGKWLEVFTYEIGFVWWFLLINGAFSYGLMIANVCLLFKHPFVKLYLWSILLAACYEITNWFFPVWRWEFLPEAWLESVIMGLFGYLGLALLMMVTLRLVSGKRFSLLPV